MKLPSDTVPLCVDLDGTLIHTDSALENLLKLLRTKPWQLVLLPVWLLGGRAHLKRKLATAVRLNPAALPYRRELVDYLEAQARDGRALILATAADSNIADDVASHLGLFSGVVASDGRQNMKGNNKRARLEHLYGTRSYDYIGDSRADAPVWDGARKALAVGVSKRTLQRWERSTPIESLVKPANGGWRALVKLLRPHHWVKNILVFSPLLLSHSIRDSSAWLESITAFVVFSLVASSIYVLNDLLDLESDRFHPDKQYRPLAGGEVSLAFGVLLVPALFLSGLVIATSLPAQVTVLLLAYLLLNAAYSMGLKRIPFLDVLMLAGFYLVRILAGSAATGIAISPWFMAFSLFLFLSLALVKRVSELVRSTDDSPYSHGRGYQAGDLNLLLIFGAVSGYISVLVFALYLNSSVSLVGDLYRHPDLLWGICPVLLYWLSRLWLLAGRGQVTSDPIVFAVRDRTSYLVMGFVLVIWCAAWGILTPS